MKRKIDPKCDRCRDHLQFESQVKWSIIHLGLVPLNIHETSNS